MKSLISLALLMPAVTFAATSFDGTWRLKLESMQFSGAPDKYEISNGNYTCGSCAPAFTVKADGADQATPVHTGRDHLAVTVVSATVVELSNKVGGKVTATDTVTVSADGSKLTVKSVDYTGPKPVTFVATEKRVAPAPKGAHAISGSWMTDSVPEVSEAGRVMVVQSTPNGLKYTQNGRTTDVKFDGKEYAVQNDPSHALVTMKKIGERQIEERRKTEGKIYDVVMWTMAADGKSIAMVDEDPVHGTKVSFVMEKQP